jgi:hypothetical protein
VLAAALAGSGSTDPDAGCCVPRTRRRIASRATTGASPSASQCHTSAVAAQVADRCGEIYRQRDDAYGDGRRGGPLDPWAR